MWYNYRLLTPNEKLQAVQVFDNTLPWNDIYIADGYLPANNGVPVTVMTQTERPKYSNKFHKDYTIYWGQIVYNNGADSLTYRDTLIHELTHVWQGHNEGQVIFNYMIRSLVSQSWAIATHFDRGKAYNYDTKNYLKWSDYNVEQQANIVEQWFSFDSNNNGGSLSVFDPRYVYIEKVIRAANPNAPNIPVIASAGISAQLKGFSPSVQAYQRLLIKKGYRIKDDGFNGQQTDGAVRDFQKRHGLKADGFVGPKTLAKLR